MQKPCKILIFKCMHHSAMYTVIIFGHCKRRNARKLIKRCSAPCYSCFLLCGNQLQILFLDLWVKRIGCFLIRLDYKTIRKKQYKQKANKNIIFSAFEHKHKLMFK